MPDRVAGDIRGVGTTHHTHTHCHGHDRITESEHNRSPFRGSSDATGNGRSTTRDPAIRGVGTDEQVGPGDGDPLWRRSPDARAFPFTIMIGIVPLIDESNA
jgi:hypothetical protein